MFRELLAHHQETLHECSFGYCFVQLWMWVGIRIWEDCIRVASSDDGQVMPETFRDFEPQ
jgi:hypothetical protein